jgi:hypothetical protein
VNIRKMIDSLRGQITAMEETVVALEKLEAINTGHKKRGRPPLPRCDRGCGKPVHKGRCRGHKTLLRHPDHAGYKRRFRRTVENA